MARFVVLLPFVLLITCIASGQSQPPSDPQALTFAGQSITAMLGNSGIVISDVTLSGTASWTSGSDTLSGTATFLAKGTNESRIDLTSTGGSRTDIRNGTGSTPQGEWVAADGSTGLYAMHNCMTDAAWFFPLLSSLANSDPTLVFSYVGQETRSGVSVQHLQAYHYSYSKSASTMALTQQLSTMDFYLDASSSLPTAFTFNEHPDDDAGTNTTVEVDFFNYQALNGMQIPIHIQQYVRGALMIDVVVSSVVVNSSLPDSDFTIQ